MGFTSWLKTAAAIAPKILPFIPGFPQALTPFVNQGIAIAESAQSLPTDPAERSAAKLQIAINEVNNAAQAANAVKPGVINTAAVNTALSSGISAVVDITNAVHSINK